MREITDALAVVHEMQAAGIALTPHASIAAFCVCTSTRYDTGRTAVAPIDPVAGRMWLCQTR